MFTGASHKYGIRKFFARSHDNVLVPTYTDTNFFFRYFSKSVFLLTLYAILSKPLAMEKMGCDTHLRNMVKIIIRYPFMSMLDILDGKPFASITATILFQSLDWFVFINLGF